MLLGNIMVNTITFLDDSTIGLKRAVDGLGEANNPLFAAESTFDAGSAFSYLSYYAAWIPNKLHTYNIHTFAAWVPLTFAVFGIAAGAFKLVKESLSLVRQRLFLKIYEKHAWTPQKIETVLTEIFNKINSPYDETRECFKRSLPEQFKDVLKIVDLQEVLGKVKAGDQAAIINARDMIFQWTGREFRDELEEIKNLDTTALRRALPEWLFEEISQKGGKDYLNDLLKKIYRCNPQAAAEGKKLVETMKSYARKKTILHVLEVIAAVVGIVGCIGLLVAFPHIVTAVLILLVGVIAISRYVMNRGYVENPNGGLSLRLCLPEFLRDEPSTPVIEPPHSYSLPPPRYDLLFAHLAQLKLPIDR